MAAGPAACGGRAVVGDPRRRSTTCGRPRRRGPARGTGGRWCRPRPGRGLAGTGAVPAPDGRRRSRARASPRSRRAGPGPGQRRVARHLEFVGTDRVGRHHGLPLGPFGVADLTAIGPPSVRPCRTRPSTVTWSCFELHPRAAAIASRRRRKLLGDVVGGDGHTGDHALDDGHQSAAVGFTGSGPTQHVPSSPWRFPT